MASSSLRAIDMERNQEKWSSLYEQGELLGVGSCGKVYKGIRRSDGQEVAIKHIPRNRTNPYMKIPGHDEPLLTEVAINQLLHKPVKCPNIVKMFDWFVEDRKHILIMEYPQPCQTLRAFLTSHRKGLKETVARHFMRQAVNASKHCIDHNLTHGDLHRGNVLMNTETSELKLIDFGFGQLIPDTPSKEPTKGVVQMVKFLCRLLFMLTTGEEQGRFREPDLQNNPRLKTLGLSKECIDLMNLCGLHEAADRPTLQQLIDHEWFKPD